MEKRLSLTVDGGGGSQNQQQHESENTMSELLEHQKQKIRKLTEQRADEIEKYNTAQREYYELVQKSDRALRPRIQAAFEKQKDNHNKRISHLTKKVENYRAKLKSKSIRKQTHSPLRSMPSAAPSERSTVTTVVDHMVLENRKLVSNRSSTSNLEAPEQEQHENEFHDSAKSSKRASLAELEGLKHAESTPMTRPESLVATSHDLDAFVEVSFYLYIFRT